MFSSGRVPGYSSGFAPSNAATSCLGPVLVRLSKQAWEFFFRPAAEMEAVGVARSDTSTRPSKCCLTEGLPAHLQSLHEWICESEPALPSASDIGKSESQVASRQIR